MDRFEYGVEELLKGPARESGRRLLFVIQGLGGCRRSAPAVGFLLARLGGGPEAPGLGRRRGSTSWIRPSAQRASSPRSTCCARAGRRTVRRGGADPGDGPRWIGQAGPRSTSRREGTPRWWRS